MDKKYYVADIGEHCAADDTVRKHLLKVFGNQCFIGCRPVSLGKCLIAVSSDTFDLANFNRPDEILLDVRSSSLEEIREMEFSGDEVIAKMLARKTSKKPSISVIAITGEDLLRMLGGLDDQRSKESPDPGDSIAILEEIRNALGKLGDNDED